MFRNNIENEIESSSIFRYRDWNAMYKVLLRSGIRWEWSYNVPSTFRNEDGNEAKKLPCSGTKIEKMYKAASTFRNEMKIEAQRASTFRNKIVNDVQCASTFRNETEN